MAIEGDQRPRKLWQKGMGFLATERVLTRLIETEFQGIDVEFDDEASKFRFFVDSSVEAFLQRVFETPEIKALQAMDKGKIQLLLDGCDWDDVTKSRVQARAYQMHSDILRLKEEAAIKRESEDFNVYDLAFEERPSARLHNFAHKYRTLADILLNGNVPLSDDEVLQLAVNVVNREIFGAQPPFKYT